MITITELQSKTVDQLRRIATELQVSIRAISEDGSKTRVKLNKAQLIEAIADAIETATPVVVETLKTVTVEVKAFATAPETREAIEDAANATVGTLTAIYAIAASPEARHIAKELVIFAGELAIEIAGVVKVLLIGFFKLANWMLDLADGISDVPFIAIEANQNGSLSETIAQGWATFRVWLEKLLKLSAILIAQATGAKPATSIKVLAASKEFA